MSSKYTLVLSNQRLSPYRRGTSDNIQLKGGIYSSNTLQAAYIENQSLNLYLYYNNNWNLMPTSYTTSKYGNQILEQSCYPLPGGHTHYLAKFTTTIDSVDYESNIVRVNIIDDYIAPPSGIQDTFDSDADLHWQSTF